MYTPKEITRDIDTKQNVAHFSYNSGINYCKEHNIKQSSTTRFSKEEFIVCCGDVMFEITEQDFPDIIRRDF